MRRSIHEIILETFNIRAELQKLDNLFFDRETVPIYGDIFTQSCTMYFFANENFHRWPFSGTCTDLEEYVDRLNENGNYRLNFDFANSNFSDEEILEIAFGNTEFYYNMINFIEFVIENSFYSTSVSTTDDITLFKKMSDILDIIIEHINGKPVELEPLKYIVIPNNEEAIAVAESVENLDTSKIILKYNHFKTKGDLEAKKSILRHLFIDIEKKGTRSVSMDDFCFILNEADIRHNNSGKKGKSITTGMTELQIEEVYDVAYRLYLMAKLDKEYKDSIKGKVNEYKNRLL
ncbi:MAG: hypothetical protein WCG21_11935 [Eubacteriales bacterium]